MGSCFADSIGSRLAANKVETLVNPFGTVFQPLALARLLRAAAGEEVDWQQHLVQARGRWQSYDLHGSIGADSPVELLQTIQELVRRTGAFLRDADVALLTLGTSWTYRLRETGELINNCHKQPADLFLRELLTPDEIINSLAETHAYLRRINPKLRFVLTVSPVRHLKDTLPLNAVSKSVLRVATHIVSDLLPGVTYFPAYELMVDDLRDYRFYAADMLHPSEVAEDYIWDKFARTYFDVDFGRFRKEWAAVRQSLGHRPLHAAAPEHRQFLEKTLGKLEQLSLRKVEVTDELREVRTKLAALPVPRQPEPEVEIEDDEERVDIGDVSATADVGVATPTTVELSALGQARPPRLSPEEFRSQRGARSGRPERGQRDGRGKGQQPLPAENEQFQATAAFVGDQSVTLDLPDEALPTTAELETTDLTIESVTAATTSDVAVADEGLVKKKKRRSRGGAKRTARKNALRLATGGIAPEAGAATGPEDLTQTPTSTASDITAEISEAQLIDKKSSVITKSKPVKRGGRRNENRILRVELFAVPPVPVDEAAEGRSDAEVEAPALDIAVPPVEIPPIVRDNPPAEPANVNSRSRGNRNRGRKEVVPTSIIEEDNVDAAPVAPALVPTVVTGSTEELIDSNSVAHSSATRERQADTPASVEAPALPEPTTPEAAPIAAARRPNRAKRAVSGGRAEKPAVDVPVVPVPDPLQIRSHVAAGRLSGSSATLIEPTTKPASPKKKAVAPKAKPAKPTAEAAPRAAASASEEPTPAAKRKPTTKPKATAAKPATPKTTAPKPTAAKPKAPKKPTKPT